MGWQFFQVERLDEIAVIRIDRPPVNAIDLEFAREADQVLERVISSSDADVSSRLDACSLAPSATA